MSSTTSSETEEPGPSAEFEVASTFEEEDDDDDDGGGGGGGGGGGLLTKEEEEEEYNQDFFDNLDDGNGNGDGDGDIPQNTNTNTNTTTKKEKDKDNDTSYSFSAKDLDFNLDFTFEEPDFAGFQSMSHGVHLNASSQNNNNKSYNNNNNNNNNGSNNNSSKIRDANTRLFQQTEEIPYFAAQNNNANNTNTNTNNTNADFQTIQQAVQEISLEWMENPAQILWIQGDLGSGKSTLLKQATVNHNLFWKCFLMKSTCEPNNNNNNNSNNNNSNNNSNSNSIISKPLSCIVESNSIISKPLSCIVEGLNDLCLRLLEQGGPAIWSKRLEEALGGEGPLLATICPKLNVLLSHGHDTKKKKNNANNNANTNNNANNNNANNNNTKNTKNANANNNNNNNTKNTKTNNTMQMYNNKNLIHQYDANTKFRLARLGFAIRDFLQAVSEYHPLVWMVDNIESVDSDSIQILQDLLLVVEGKGGGGEGSEGSEEEVSSSSSSSPLQNFLLIGCYETTTSTSTSTSTKSKDKSKSKDKDKNLHPIELMKQAILANNNDNDNDNDEDTNDNNNNNTNNNTRMTEINLKPFDLPSVEEWLCMVFLQDEFGEYDNNNNNNNGDGMSQEDMDRIQDLSEILYALTGGNILWMTCLLRLWNDQKLITFDPQTQQWEWNRKKIKKQTKAWKVQGNIAFDSVDGVLQTRMELLPPKLRFVVQRIAALGLTFFQVKDLYEIIEDSDFLQEKKKKSPPINNNKTNKTNKTNSSSSSIVASQEELQTVIHKLCTVHGIFKKVAKSGFYKFAHDQMRASGAATLWNLNNHHHHHHSGGGGGKKKPPVHSIEEIVSQIHFRMGSHLSTMCLKAKGEERERYKFLAVDQLNLCGGGGGGGGGVGIVIATDEEKAKLAKLHLEAAEIAISKTAFRTAVQYLESGRSILPPNIQWQKPYYDVTLRTHLFLARMRQCTGRLEAAKAACEEIMEHGATLKDKVNANQIYVIILMDEQKSDEALKRTLDYLGKLGEQFPPMGDQVPNIVNREVSGLRKTIQKRENQQLVNPPKMTDKKSIDIMLLMATLVDICSKAKRPSPPKPDPNSKDDKKNKAATSSPLSRRFETYRDLAMIRMMHISLRFGFSRQYPLAFALFSVALVKRGAIKEAHRIGQVAERVARLTDFYGGISVALFHWHVSHWRRTCKRNLEPVLKIYNAQVDSGDFHHVDFSITTYVQYHLASGYDLERLSDNLQLFDGIYMDYNLPNDWHLEMPEQAVASLMAETADPLVFFGDTLEQQEAKIQELEEAEEHDALEYFYLLRLYIAFFFHEVGIMEECLAKLTRPAEGVWIPWRLFFECHILIQTLPGSKGKKRNHLKDTIEEKKNQLIDWYNEGAPNPNAMVSILEAELVIAKEAGKGLSAMKVEGLFKEAIEAAVQDGALHLEAFVCELAGIHFDNTGVDGLSSQYLYRAHKVYDKWHAVAKVIDIEFKFSDKLKISKRRKRDASAYIHRNQRRLPNSGKIGGGHGEVKTISIKKIVKGAKKFGTKTKKGLKTRKIKNIFGKKEHKAEPGNHGNTESTASGNIPKSPSKPKSRSSLFGSRRGSGAHAGDGTDTPLSPRSPKKPLSAIFGKKKGGENFAELDDDDTASSHAGQDDSKSLKPRPSKQKNKNKKKKKKEADTISPPFQDDDDDGGDKEEEKDEEDETEKSSKPSNKGAKKFGKGKKKKVKDDKEDDDGDEAPQSSTLTPSKKPKKKLRGLFGKKKKKDDNDETEDHDEDEE